MMVVIGVWCCTYVLSWFGGRGGGWAMVPHPGPLPGGEGAGFSFGPGRRAGLIFGNACA